MSVTKDFTLSKIYVFASHFMGTFIKLDKSSSEVFKYPAPQHDSARFKTN